jgi:ATP-dependent DNA helicase PIF1
MRRQFRVDTKVRRHVIKAWLLHLKSHHPGYKDIEIAHDNLDALEEEFFANDEFIIHEIENEEVINAAAIDVDTDDEEYPEIGAVPDLAASQKEVDAINSQL